MTLKKLFYLNIQRKMDQWLHQFRNPTNRIVLGTKLLYSFTTTVLFGYESIQCEINFIAKGFCLKNLYYNIKINSKNTNVVG